MQITEGLLKIQSDVVLIEPIDETLDASLLIHIPGETDKVRLGVVKHCGPGKRCKKTGLRQPICVMTGNKVLFGKNTGEDLFMNLGGVNLLALREPDIIAIIT